MASMVVAADTGLTATPMDARTAALATAPTDSNERVDMLSTVAQGCAEVRPPRLQPAGLRGEGIYELDVVATDRARAGATFHLCGVVIRLV